LSKTSSGSFLRFPQCCEESFCSFFLFLACIRFGSASSSEWNHFPLDWDQSSRFSFFHFTPVFLLLSPSTDGTSTSSYPDSSELLHDAPSSLAPFGLSLASCPKHHQEVFSGFNNAAKGLYAHSSFYFILTCLWRWNRVFRNIGILTTDARESPRRKHTTFITRRNFAIKENMFCLQDLNDIISLIHIYKNAVKMHCSLSQHYVKNIIVYRLGLKPEK
jgi:hypothetical protein